MNLHSREDLLENLKDKEFRDSFVAARIDGGTAFQVRYMREKKGWTQAELARRLETSQNAVWRLESPNYGRANISTLKKTASVFDVALIVRFVRFSELVDHVLNLSTDSFTVEAFDEDFSLYHFEESSPVSMQDRSKKVLNIADWLAGKSQEATVNNQGVVSSHLLENLAGTSVQSVSSPEQSTGEFSLCSGQR